MPILEPLVNEWRLSFKVRMAKLWKQVEPELNKIWIEYISELDAVAGKLDPVLARRLGGMKIELLSVKSEVNINGRNLLRNFSKCAARVRDKVFTMMTGAMMPAFEKASEISGIGHSIQDFFKQLKTYR